MAKKDPPKKIKAVDLAKYKSEGYEFKAPGTNGAEFYELPGKSRKSPTVTPGSVTPPSKTPVDPSKYEGDIIKLIKEGYDPRKMPGLISPDRIDEFMQYYEPKTVYTEPEPKVVTPMILGKGSNVERKIIPTQNTDYTSYQYPDVNAGYSKATTKHFFDNKEIDPTKSYDASGKFIPSYISGAGVNQGTNLGTIKPNVSYTTPSPLSIKVGDELGLPVRINSGQDVRNVGSGLDIKKEDYIQSKKKGGIVAKVKGYKLGGETTKNISSIGGAVTPLVDAAGNEITQKGYRSDGTQNMSNATWGGAMRGASAVTPLALNPALLAATGGLSSLAIPVAGGVNAAIANRKAKDQNADIRKAQQDAKNADLAQIQQGNQLNSLNKANEERQSYLGGANYKKGGLIAKVKGYNNGGMVDPNQFDGNGLIKVPYTDSADTGVVIEEPSFIPYNPEEKGGFIGGTGGGGFGGGATPMFKKGGMIKHVKECSKGGKIEGKGNGTSDSIKAKVEAGSFIVPAKNADVAKEVAKKVLKVPAIKKATLNEKGGEEVKLSNGEFKFTPEETQKIKANLGEEFLEMLAPEAEENDEMAKGGKVKAPTVKKKLTVEEMRKLAPQIDETMSVKEEFKLPQYGNAGKKEVTLDELDTSGVTAEKDIPRQRSGMSGSQLAGLLSEGSSLISGIRGQNFSRNQINKANKFLAETGKRPIGAIDSGFQKALNKAEAEAKYGLSAVELAALNNENVGLRNQQVDQAKNLSGGSAANAYAMTRSAINDSFGRGLKTSIANRQTQLAKQAQANNLIAQKADMNRQLFEDTMNAWNTNQKSGAALLGAGLENELGGRRYNEAMRQLAINRANEQGWLNNI